MNKDLETYYYGNQLGKWVDGSFMKLCNVCGALAGNTVLHINWHEGTK